MTSLRQHAIRATLYLLAVFILVGAVGFTYLAEAQGSGHWIWCANHTGISSWQNMFQPAECGGIPGDAYCYQDCLAFYGSGQGACSTTCSWQVWVEDPPSCVPHAGTACSSGANGCSMVGTGTYSCEGVCSATTPSDALCPPACSPNAGQSCSSAPNSCGMTGSGTYSCGGVCSAAVPSDNSCPAACVPNVGQSCGSAPNACGMVGWGTYTCGGACSAATPSNASCPVTPEPEPEPEPGGGGAPTGCFGAAAEITASPDRVRRGTTARLTVTASGINTSCTVTGPGVNQTFTPSSCGVSGSIFTPPINNQSTYTVSCDGGVVTEHVIVNLVPWYRLF